eukprot:scaffold23062_cov55-Phaeocystis_antarctica.AAC.4
MNISGSSGRFSRSRVTQSFMYAVTPHRSRYSSASSEPASAVVGACRARAARHMPGGILALPRVATRSQQVSLCTNSERSKRRPNEPHALRIAQHTLSPAARPDEVPWVRPHSRHTYLPQSPPTLLYALRYSSAPCACGTSPLHARLAALARAVRPPTCRPPYLPSLPDPAHPGHTAHPRTRLSRAHGSAAHRHVRLGQSDLVRVRVGVGVRGRVVRGRTTLTRRQQGWRTLATDARKRRRRGVRWAATPRAAAAGCRRSSRAGGVRQRRPLPDLNTPPLSSREAHCAPRRGWRGGSGSDASSRTCCPVGRTCASSAQHAKQQRAVHVSAPTRALQLAAPYLGPCVWSRRTSLFESRSLMPASAWYRSYCSVGAVVAVPIFSVTQKCMKVLRRS